MSLFEQSLINNYVFSENLENQIAGGAPITELLASQSVQPGGLSGGGGGGGGRGHESSVLSNKKHLSVPVGLVMMAHTEYVYPNQRYCNRDVQEPLFDNLIDLIRDSENGVKGKTKTKGKSLKHRGEVPKKQTKKHK
jgi:hypothetical protein